MLLRSPIEVYWCLTDRCNLRCAFCLSDSDPQVREDELDPRQRETILDDLIRNRVLKVFLTGGEPLLIPETPHYARRLSENGIFTVLTTNAVLLDQTTIKLLREYGLNRIQVSIHGSTPELNDSIMGGHTFERVMSALGWICEAGLDLHIKITLTRQNIRDLPALVHKLIPFRPSLINASEVMAVGRGFINYASLRPSQDELARARDEAAAFNSRGIHVSFRSPSLLVSEAGRPSTCTLGDESATVALILPDGTMTPCTPAHIWGLSNNVLEWGIQGAWERLPLYAQFLHAGNLQGRCRTCDLVVDCKGGCRAEAYLHTKDIWGEYTPCIRLCDAEKE